MLTTFFQEVNLQNDVRA